MCKNNLSFSWYIRFKTSGDSNRTDVRIQTGLLIGCVLYSLVVYLYLVWFSMKKAYFTLVQHTLITVTSQTVSTESDSQTYGPFKMPHFFKQLNKKVKVIFQAASRVKNRAVSSAMPAANSSSFVRTLRNSFRRRKKPDVSLQTLYC